MACFCSATIGCFAPGESAWPWRSSSPWIMKAVVSRIWMARSSSSRGAARRAGRFRAAAQSAQLCAGCEPQGIEGQRPGVTRAASILDTAAVAACNIWISVHRLLPSNGCLRTP